MDLVKLDLLADRHGIGCLTHLETYSWLEPSGNAEMVDMGVCVVGQDERGIRMCAEDTGRGFEPVAVFVPDGTDVPVAIQRFMHDHECSAGVVLVVRQLRGHYRKDPLVRMRCGF